MAITVRKTDQELQLAIVYALNALQGNVVTDGYHRDLTQTTNSPLFDEAAITLTQVTVSAPTAVDLPSTVLLANNVWGVLNTHMLDDQVHLKKDLVNAPSQDGYAEAVDLPSVEVLLNAVKLLFTAHLTQSGVHPHNDTTSYGLPTNAVDLTTSENLANALASAVNTHMANAGTNFNSPRIKIVSP